MDNPLVFNLRWSRNPENSLQVFKDLAINQTPRFEGSTPAAERAVLGREAGRPAAAQQAPRRVATEADISATLAAHPGMTREQVIQRVRSMGYEVGGE
jgi:hypothetical protein